MRKVGKAGHIRFITCWLVLIARPVLADVPGCPKSEITPAAQKGLQKAARHVYADQLDLQTLYYCVTTESARAIIDTIPQPQSDGSEFASTLSCSGSPDHARDWTCQVHRYRAIRVAAGAGQSQVSVEVDERASPETTREYALRAFALLNQPGRVEACQRTAGSGLTTEALRAALARRQGPYRLVVSREGFALVRFDLQVRMRAANEFNQRAQLQCWEEQAIEE